MKRFLTAAALAAFALARPGMALAGMGVTLDHGSVWQTNKVGDSTQGFLEIHNAGDAVDVLTGWDCSIADSTLLVGADGKKLTSLAIPAGQTVTLTENGPHLLLQETHYTVDYGSVVPCAFTFQEAGDIGGYLNAAPAPAGN